MQMGTGPSRVHTVATDTTLTLQCGNHAPIPATVTHTVSTTGQNVVLFEVEALTVPPGGTLVCFATLPRLGHDRVNAIAATERLLFRHYDMTADGVTLRANATAESVRVRITFHAPGIAPAPANTAIVARTRHDEAFRTAMGYLLIALVPLTCVTVAFVLFIAATAQ
jgi:hypothetical protein